MAWRCTDARSGGGGVGVTHLIAQFTFQSADIEPFVEGQSRERHATTIAQSHESKNVKKMETGNNDTKKSHASNQMVV